MFFYTAMAILAAVLPFVIVRSADKLKLSYSTLFQEDVLGR